MIFNILLLPNIIRQTANLLDLKESANYLIRIYKYDNFTLKTNNYISNFKF